MVPHIRVEKLLVDFLVLQVCLEADPDFTLPQLPGHVNLRQKKHLFGA